MDIPDNVSKEGIAPAGEEPQVLVIWDGDGGYFIIPTAALETYRVAPEQLPNVEPMLRGEDVTGYTSAIDNLVTAAQIRAMSADQQLQQAAEQQRALLSQKKKLRQVQAVFAAYVDK